MTTSPTHDTPPDALARELPSIAYERWRFPIQTATDLDQLLHVVATYVGTWSPTQLSILPPELASPTLIGSDDLMSRAVIASRAEITCPGDARHYSMLREMAFTLLAAAARLRNHQAVRAGRA
jgi:hypothetical protein